MIHVQALPGTPKSTLALSAIIAQAKEEAQLYRAAGVDAIAVTYGVHNQTQLEAFSPIAAFNSVDETNQISGPLTTA